MEKRRRRNKKRSSTIPGSRGPCPDNGSPVVGRESGGKARGKVNSASADKKGVTRTPSVCACSIGLEKHTRGCDRLTGAVENITVGNRGPIGIVVQIDISRSGQEAAARIAHGRGGIAAHRGFSVRARTYILLRGRKTKESVRADTRTRCGAYCTNVQVRSHIVVRSTGYGVRRYGAPGTERGIESSVPVSTRDRCHLRKSFKDIRVSSDSTDGRWRSKTERRLGTERRLKTSEREIARMTVRSQPPGEISPGDSGKTGAENVPSPGRSRTR